MKPLTNCKFNYLHKTLLLSSVLVSSLAIAQPMQNTKKPIIKSKTSQVKKTSSNKAKAKPISKKVKKTNKSTKKPIVKSKTSQVKKTSSNKAKVKPITKKVKKTNKSTKKPIVKNKISQVKTTSSNKAKAKLITKKVKKTNKSTKKPIVKSKVSLVKKTSSNKAKAKLITNKKSVVKKQPKKQLGSDEISVEQLDLKKLLAGTKIETTHSLINENVHTQVFDITWKNTAQKGNKIKIEKYKPNNVQSEQNPTSSELYMQALKAYSDKNTSVAIRKFKKYINDYPNGNLIPKAKYWLAETYLQKEPIDYANARYYFLEVVNNYENHPQNDKQSKALYRLSQLSHVNNYSNGLKKYTNKLKKKYPNAKETKLALKLLNK